MAFGVLDPVTDKAAIDYDRNMINDFLSAIEAGSLEVGLSVFTERDKRPKMGRCIRPGARRADGRDSADCRRSAAGILR